MGRLFSPQTPEAFVLGGLMLAVKLQTLLGLVWQEGARMNAKPDHICERVKRAFYHWPGTLRLPKHVVEGRLIGDKVRGGA